MADASLTPWLSDGRTGSWDAGAVAFATILRQGIRSREVPPLAALRYNLAEPNLPQRLVALIQV